MTSNDESGNRWFTGPRMLGLALVLAVIAVFLPAMSRHAEFSAEPHAFTDDADQHIVPYLADYKPGLFPGDIIPAYFKACHPIGYRFLYQTAAQGMDPRVLSKILPYLLLAVTAAALAWGVFPLTGLGGSLVVLALTLGCEAIFSRMGGGLPRAFAFPCFAVAMAGMLRGRPGLVALSTIAAALFYPVTAVAGGLGLTLLMILPASQRGSAAAWTFRRRVVWVAATGLLTLAVLMPPLLATKPFGPQISPDDYEAFPEAGPYGRLVADDRADYQEPFGPVLHQTFFETFSGRGPALVPALHSWIMERDPETGTPNRYVILLLGVFILSAMGFLGMCITRPESSRLILLAACVWIAYQASILLTPRLFMPQRHLAYTLPLFSIIMIPVGLYGMFGFLFGQIRDPVWSKRLPLLKGAATALAGFVFVILTGTTMYERTGFVRHNRDIINLIEVFRYLPAEAVIAGWPPFVDDIPYIAERSVLLSDETYLPYHAAYTETMRERMWALLRAMYADSLEPLIRLRDEFGVTHLLVYKPHLERPPLYFLPFTPRILELRRFAENAPFIVPSLCRDHALYDEGAICLLELAGLEISP